MKDVSFKCNALIEGRRATTGDANVDRFGNWIGGAVVLREDHLIFSTNALNEMVQEDSSDLVVPYREITSIALGRLMMLFKTVDLGTRLGKVRFRCMGSSNDKLLTEVRGRGSW